MTRRRGMAWAAGAAMILLAAAGPAAPLSAAESAASSAAPGDPLARAATALDASGSGDTSGIQLGDGALLAATVVLGPPHGQPAGPVSPDSVGSTAPATDVDDVRTPSFLAVPETLFGPWLTALSTAWSTAAAPAGSTSEPGTWAGSASDIGSDPAWDGWSSAEADGWASAAPLPGPVPSYVRTSAELPQGMMLNHPVGGSFTLSSVFGWRKNPTGLGDPVQFHIGQDYPVACGTPVRAAADGTITFSGVKGTAGLRVDVDHGGGLATAYRHNSHLLVEPDDRVFRGDLLALSGTTGNSTGCHLHFEVTLDGFYLDPASVLPRVAGQPRPLQAAELEQLRTEGARIDSSGSEDEYVDRDHVKHAPSTPSDEDSDADRTQDDDRPASPDSQTSATDRPAPGSSSTPKPTSRSMPNPSTKPTPSPSAPTSPTPSPTSESTEPTPTPSRPTPMPSQPTPSPNETTPTPEPTPDPTPTPTPEPTSEPTDPPTPVPGPADLDEDESLRWCVIEDEVEGEEDTYTVLDEDGSAQPVTAERLAELNPGEAWLDTLPTCEELIEDLADGERDLPEPGTLDESSTATPRPATEADTDADTRPSTE